MTVFKGLFPDAFYQVEAASEAEAETKLVELLIADLRAKEVTPIVWEEAKSSGFDLVGTAADSTSAGDKA